MRAAPAVQATLSPDRGWLACARGLAALALAGLAAWAAQGLGGPGWATALAAAGAALAGLLAGARLVGAHTGTLRWDGAAWSWQPLGAAQPLAGRIEVMIDLGPWMLLRLQSVEAGTLWLPLAQSACGPAWRALRSALHARGAPE
jgi:hypothetical protein